MSSRRNRTMYVRNLDSRVNEELLYELFLQAGPLVEVFIPRNDAGEMRGFAFVEYEDEESVKYALELFEGSSLFQRELVLAPRDGSKLHESRMRERARRNERSREYERDRYSDRNRQQYAQHQQYRAPPTQPAPPFPPGFYGAPYNGSFQPPPMPPNWQAPSGPLAGLPPFVNPAVINNPQLAMQLMAQFGGQHPPDFPFANTQFR